MFFASVNIALHKLQKYTVFIQTNTFARTLMKW